MPPLFSVYADMTSPPKHTPFDALLSPFLNEKERAFESFCGFCALKTSRHVKNYYFCSALRRLPLVEKEISKQSRINSIDLQDTPAKNHSQPTYYII